MVWRVMICEDAEHIRKALGRIIEEQGQFEVVAEAGSGHEALSAFFDSMPHVLFQDIKLPDMNGTEVVKRLRTFNDNFKVVFITAFADYREEAFSVYATDYLVKPFKTDRICQTLQRLNKELLMMHNQRYFVAKQKQKKFFIPIDDIICIEKDERKAAIITERDRYLVNISLQKISERLPDFFQRINQWQIVNLRRILSLETCIRDRYYVMKLKQLKKTVEVTPTYRRELIDKVNLMGV